jgi:ubiquinone/menaquinone biosynthesis C-methylase UbiE
MHKAKAEDIGRSAEASGTIRDFLMACSMVFGRGRAALIAVDESGLTDADRVVDIGSGPGTAVRAASKRCAHATGIDPSPASVRLGSWINRIRRCDNATIDHGYSEALPLPDGSATVVWSLSAFHHWSDQHAGLVEARRVLAPGGRILIMERLVKPGASGHALHGLTGAQMDDASEALGTAGFDHVAQHAQPSGRTTWCLVCGSRAA